MVDILCEKKTMGLCGFYDELASLFAELEARHNSAMRAELLSLWTGSAVSRDTKMNGHVYAASSALSIFGNIQPEKLQSLINKDGGDTAGDGLWCRFLWFRPKSTTWQYNPNEAIITRELANIFSALDGVKSDTVLKLSDEAVTIGAAQWNEWELQKQDVGSGEAAFLGKLRGYSVRIAGLLHLLDIAYEHADDHSLILPLVDDTVPVVAMERALLLCRFCHKQWQQLQTEIGHGAVPAVVAKFITRAQGLPIVTSRDVVRWKILGRNTPSADAAAFLREVADRWGYGQVRTGQRGGVDWVP
jgi:hypothetical protein